MRKLDSEFKYLVWFARLLKDKSESETRMSDSGALAPQSCALKVPGSGKVSKSEQRASSPQFPGYSPAKALNPSGASVLKTTTGEQESFTSVF